MRWRIGVVGAVTIVVALPMAAQSSRDSLSFRRGQWGAEFAAGTEARSLGVLRFISSHRALVLDGSSGYNKATSDQTREATNHALDVRLGLRWFRDVAPRVRQYFTVGASGGVRREHRENEASGVAPSTYRSTSGGAFANVGGMWLATAHLALGANWEASYTRAAVREENQTTQSRTTSHGLSVGTARLVLSLLF